METDMCGTENRTELPLASAATGCGCCSTEASSAPSTAANSDAEFAVEGLTCGHCVQTVQKAVSALEGVESASVDLVPGGRSRLIVGGKADSSAVREAVTSAGYTLISN
jgi:copper chaperone